MRTGFSYLLFYIFTVVIVNGCSDQKEDIFDTSLKSSDTMELVVTLQVDCSDLANPYTRSGDDSSTLTPEENEVNRLTLFITSFSDGKEVLEGYQSLDSPDISGLLRFKLSVEKGSSKRFYIGANMTAEQISAFKGEDTIFSVPDVSGYSNAAYVMDIDGKNGKGSNIVMSARIMKDGKADIPIEGESIYIDVPVKLTRVVAKVLLTCSQGQDENHLKVADHIGGWVRTGDMRYLLNTFDRKFYLFPHDKDVNYLFSSFINDQYELMDKTSYTSNFMRFDMEEIMDKLQSSTIESYHMVLPFNPSRVYTEGLYCLENRVFGDLAMDKKSEKFFHAVQWVTTHMIVAARYVPQKIYRAIPSEQGEGLTLDYFVAEDEQSMLAELKGQKEIVGTQEHIYPDGTFWYYKNQYFTMKGLQLYKEMMEVDMSQIQRYDGGWGYYASLIDGVPGDSGVLDYTGVDRWGLVRNDYYILKLKELTPPGAPVPGIKIKLVPIIEPWKNKDVDLEMDETVG